MRAVTTCIHTKVIAIILTIGLSGCLPVSTPTKNIRQVGPSPATGNVPVVQSTPINQQYPYSSAIYLDVVIPVFDTGLPHDERGNLDYHAIEKQGLWPQLRRAEANRFAVDTRTALEKTGAFGSVSVVPSETVSGDIYLLGRIQKSDSETIALLITVIDSQGKLWGERQFSHQVSTGFFRDRENKDKDPYEPVFQRIADYLYQLLLKQSENAKQTIKTITAIRYAQSYAPEAFSEYIERIPSDDNVQYRLITTPDSNSAMSRRIAPLRLQSQLFIDRLQVHYERFYATTNTGYRLWQEETLPEILALKKSRNERNTRAGLGILLATAAILLDKNSDSTAGQLGTAVGALGSGILLGDAMNKNAELKIHKQTLDEMGESLDLQISPQLMEHNEQTIELTGTAREQYAQWRAHLQAIYDIENQP